MRRLIKDLIWFDLRGKGRWGTISLGVTHATVFRPCGVQLQSHLKKAADEVVIAPANKRAAGLTKSLTEGTTFTKLLRFRSPHCSGCYGPFLVLSPWRGH